MDSFKLSVWVTIGLLTASITTPSLALGDNHAEKDEGGARRPERPMEEVIVVGSRDTMETVSFRVGLSDIILIHEYNKEDDTWELVSLRDTRRGTSTAITH
tara:strand:+ start:386 stop:688 length:303 start_codon:yes stop_codon:yes gene_type:complete